MEKKIFFIGLRKLHSEKKEKDYYMVDYVNKKTNQPKTDYIDLETYNTIAKKAKPYTECVGIFAENNFEKLYLSDIKI